MAKYVAAVPLSIRRSAEWPAVGENSDDRSCAMYVSAECGSSAITDPSGEDIIIVV